MSNLNVRFAVAAFAAATMLAAAADAQPTPANPEGGGVTVSYGDLDIGHMAGAETLYHRIRAASTDACGGAPAVTALDDIVWFDQCREDATRRALTEVDAPLVWAAARGDADREIDVASR